MIFTFKSERKTNCGTNRQLMNGEFPANRRRRRTEIEIESTREGEKVVGCMVAEEHSIFFRKGREENCVDPYEQKTRLHSSRTSTCAGMKNMSR